jgi:hypothetical protein
MDKQNRDPLENRLSEWKVDLPTDPQLGNHVLNRIAAARTRRAPAAIIPVLKWSTGLAAALAFLAVIFINDRDAREELLADNAGTYQLMIDPVSRAHTAKAPATGLNGDSLIDQLAWMQDRLDLSQEQFLELVDLHNRYAGQFETLYTELVRLESRYEEFEQLRVNNEMIDFLALYEVLSERKEKEGSAMALSRELVARVSAILRADQRGNYLSLIKFRPGDA